MTRSTETGDPHDHPDQRLLAPLLERLFEEAEAASPMN